MHSCIIMSKKENKAAWQCDGTQFDSAEEIEFYIFLKDGKRLGFIRDFTYQPESFVLIPKATVTEEVPYKRKHGSKVKERVLYREHSYTADFSFVIQPDLFARLGNTGLLHNGDNVVYVDIKGKYNRHGGDRIFPIHQKLLYYKYGIHLNKVVPEDFFRRIGCAPDAIMWMKGRKTKTRKTAYRGMQTLDERFGEEYVPDTQINVPFLK